jgi:Cell wall-active antibiotics response 4TMS YvqF
VSTPPPPPPAPVERSPTAGRLAFGLVLLGIGAGWLLEALGVDIPWDLVLPSVLIAIGGLLIITARSGAGQGGLITGGVVLTIVLLVGTAFDVPFTGGVGERTVRPTELVMDREVELAMGELTFDLTEVDFATIVGGTELRARVGVGQLMVIVPDDASIRVEARSGLGNVQVFGQEEGGVDAEVTIPAAIGAPAITLIATVGIGEVQVEHG